MLKVLLGCLLCCVLGTSGLCVGSVDGDAVVDSGFADWLAEYYLPTVEVRVVDVQIAPSNDGPGMNVVLLLRNDGELPAQLHGWSIALTNWKLHVEQAVRSIPVPTGVILGAGDTETIEFGIHQGMRFEGFQLVGAVAVDNVPVRTRAVQQILLDDEVSDALAGNGCGCTVWTWAADSEQWASEVNAAYDVTPPVIQCPNDLVVEAAPCSGGAIVVFDEPTVTDDCTQPRLLHVSGTESGTFFEIGTHRETYVAIDEVGNVAQESFKIDVRLTEDTTPPVISCPDGVVVRASSCDGGAVVDFDQPTATDDCSQPTLVHVSGLESGSFFEIGAHQETYVAIDESGNVTQESFTIDVRPAPCRITVQIASVELVHPPAKRLDRQSWRLFVRIGDVQREFDEDTRDLLLYSRSCVTSIPVLEFAAIDRDTIWSDIGIVAASVPLVGERSEDIWVDIPVLGNGTLRQSSECATWTVHLVVERTR